MHNQNFTLQTGKFDEILAYSPGNITFTITNSLTYKNKKGEETTDYTTHICKAYKDYADKVKKGAKKGCTVTVIGKYIDTHYTRKIDGKFASEKQVLCRIVTIEN